MKTRIFVKGRGGAKRRGWKETEDQELSNNMSTRGKMQSVSSMQELPPAVTFNMVLALAATRVSLGVSRTIACLDVSNAFLHAGTKDEDYAKLDLETLKLICSG